MDQLWHGMLQGYRSNAMQELQQRTIALHHGSWYGSDDKCRVCFTPFTIPTAVLSKLQPECIYNTACEPLPHLALLVELLLQRLHTCTDVRQAARHGLVERRVGLHHLARLIIHHRLTQEVDKPQGLLNLQLKRRIITRGCVLKYT